MQTNKPIKSPYNVVAITRVLNDVNRKNNTAEIPANINRPDTKIILLAVSRSAKRPKTSLPTVLDIPGKLYKIID